MAGAGCVMPSAWEASSINNHTQRYTKPCLKGAACTTKTPYYACVEDQAAAACPTSDNRCNVVQQRGYKYRRERKDHCRQRHQLAGQALFRPAMHDDGFQGSSRGVRMQHALHSRKKVGGCRAWASQAPGARRFYPTACLPSAANKQEQLRRGHTLRG